MFFILRRCFRQMPSVFVRNFCIVPPDSFFLIWYLPFLPPRVEVYDKILSFANRGGLTVTAKATVAMAFKLCQQAEKGWRRLKGFEKIDLVAKNIEFENGVLKEAA